MSPLAYLAFDLGATSWRAILGKRGPGGIEFEVLHRQYHAPVDVGGGLYWDFNGIFEGVKSVLHMVAKGNVPISAIGIDSWSVDYGLLDASGTLLERPRSYRDPRNRGMADKISKRIGIPDLFERTGLMIEDHTTVCQLVAASEQNPELLQRAARLLFMSDLLRYRLCGVQATDFTLASTSQLYDLRRRKWDGDLMRLLGLPDQILPPIRYGHSVLGYLSEQLQREIGLGPVPIATGASHDSAAAFMTQPAEEGRAILSSGTWSVLGVHLESPVFSKNLDPYRYGHEGNPDGSVRLLCTIPGMWILEQCMEAWRSQRKRYTYGELVEGARESSGYDGRIDPYDAAFTLPDDMPTEIARFCSRTGQREPGTPFETARAIFLGLARTYAMSLSELSSLSGKEIRTVAVLGGGGRNDLLNHMIEQEAGVDVVPGEPEATAVGNIMSQEMALRSGAQHAGDDNPDGDRKTRI